MPDRLRCFLSCSPSPSTASYHPCASIWAARLLCHVLCVTQRGVFCCLLNLLVVQQHHPGMCCSPFHLPGRLCTSRFSWYFGTCVASARVVLLGSKVPWPPLLAGVQCHQLRCRKSDRTCPSSTSFRERKVLQGLSCRGVSAPQHSSAWGMCDSLYIIASISPYILYTCILCLLICSTT